MDKSYLIKRKSLLLAGIKDADDTSTIISFNNISLRTDLLDADPSNFVIPTEGKVNQMVIDAERNAHKQIKGEISVNTEADVTASMAAFAAGTDLTLDDGTIYNNKPYDPTTAPNGATAGDVIFYVASPTATNFKTEEALVKSDYTMVLLSSTNSDDKRLDTVEGELSGISDDLTAISNEDSNNLKISNAKDITGHGAINHTDDTAVEPNKIPTREEVASAVRGLNQDVEATEGRLTTTEGVATAADTLSKTNAGLIGHNTTNIATNVTNIHDNKVEADATRDQVALNTPQINTNFKAIATNREDITSNTDKINVNIAGIAGADVRITAVETKSNANETDIVTLKGDDASHTSRLDAIEGAQDLDDKVWVGSIPLTGSDDLSTIQDDQGNTFDFANGKRLMLYIKHTGDNQGKSTEITVGDTAGGSITIPTGNQSDTLKIDLMDNGTLTSSVTNGNTPVTAYEIYRLIEAKSVKAISTSYSKSESDAKYTLKSTTAALDTRVATNLASIGTISTDVNANKTDIAANKVIADAAELKADFAGSHAERNEVKITTNISNIAKNVTAIAKNTADIIAQHGRVSTNELHITDANAKITTNTTAIAAKQDKTDAALTTSTKSVVGAINELKTGIDNIPVKDLTHLITQDEIYNAVEANKSGYKVKIGGIEYLTSNVAYTATLAEFTINAMVSGQQQNEFILVNKGNTGVPLKQLARTFTGEPTDDRHAATKKYVDDNAGGKWTVITDLWTNTDKFNKYKDTKLRITDEYDIVTVLNQYDVFNFIFSGAGAATNNVNNIVITGYMVDQTKPDKVIFGATDAPATEIICKKVEAFI